MVKQSHFSCSNSSDAEDHFNSTLFSFFSSSFGFFLLLSLNFFYFLFLLFLLLLLLLPFDLLLYTRVVFPFFSCEVVLQKNVLEDFIRNLLHIHFTSFVDIFADYCKTLYFLIRRRGICTASGSPQ